MRGNKDPNELASNLPQGRETLHGLLDGTCRIDKQAASLLEIHLGGSEAFWLKRQKNFEDALERALDRAEIVEGDDWLLLPVPGPRPRGRLSSDKRREEIKRRLVFYNVGTLGAWQARYGKVQSDTLFRTSETFASSDVATLMWLRSGEIGADLAQTQDWKPGNLQDRMDEIKKLSKVKAPERFLPKLKALFAEAGVALVAKRAPQGCRASGASRMIAPDKAMVLVSFRGRSDDKFWFTVFHEAAHLLLHDAQTFVDADLGEQEGVVRDEAEREANEFASERIVPKYRQEEFSQLSPEKDDVVRFGVSVGVAPGLVVGQMQHRKMIAQNQLNFLKRHWTWNQLDGVLD
ncbi:MAG: ImmA/IrrE family metallo-endopeptidase [Erythrobacter sp.]